MGPPGLLFVARSHRLGSWTDREAPPGSPGFLSTQDAPPCMVEPAASTRGLHLAGGRRAAVSPWPVPGGSPRLVNSPAEGAGLPQHRPWSATLATALLFWSRELWRPLNAVPCSGSAWTAHGGGPWSLVPRRPVCGCSGWSALGRALRGRTPLGRPLALRHVWFQAQRTLLTDVKVELEPALGTCTRLGSQVGPRGPGRSLQPWALTWTPWFCPDHALSPGFPLPACRAPPGVPLPPRGCSRGFPGRTPLFKVLPALRPESVWFVLSFSFPFQA